MLVRVALKDFSFLVGVGGLKGYTKFAVLHHQCGWRSCGCIFPFTNLSFSGFRACTARYVLEQLLSRRVSRAAVEEGHTTGALSIRLIPITI